jgi:hypothetical protein
MSRLLLLRSALSLSPCAWQCHTSKASRSAACRYGRVSSPIQPHRLTGDHCWFVLREKYRWLVAHNWFVLREKYCWLVLIPIMHRHRTRLFLIVVVLYFKKKVHGESETPNAHPWLFLFFILFLKKIVLVPSMHLCFFFRRKFVPCIVTATFVTGSRCWYHRNKKEATVATC